MNRLMKQFVKESGLNDDDPNCDIFSDAYTWVYKHEYGDWLEKELKAEIKQDLKDYDKSNAKLLNNVMEISAKYDKQSKLITDMMEWMELTTDTSIQSYATDLIQRAKEAVKE